MAPRIALVHDFLLDLRGAERVFAAICDTWPEREPTIADASPVMRAPLRVLLNRWRQWDWIAAQRVDRYVANSQLTASRVHRYLGREATVLHPPVEIDRFRPGRVGEHYLLLSELMAHK